MKDAYRMYNSDMNKTEKNSFGELLSWVWAIAKESLYSYLRTGYANDYISIKNV